MTDTTITPTLDEGRLEQFLGQVVADFSATEATAAAYVGDRLGLYRRLATSGPVTAEELARATGTNERLVLEWVRGQVAGGYLHHDPETRTFTLPPEHAAVLADESSSAYMAGLLDIIASLWADTEAVQAAFHGDGGLDWGAHDHRLYDGVARLFGPVYEGNLVSEWLPSLKGVVDKLTTGARVADLGCGWGKSTAIMAAAFPSSTFVGFDIHEPSIEAATREAVARGVATNTEFHVLDAAEEIPGKCYDLVCFFDALHDMGDPLAAAKRALRALRDDGTLLLVEPAAGDTLADNVNPVSRLFYAGSVLLCTPSALAQHGPVALGAQAGPKVLIDLLTEAGFDTARVTWSSSFNTVIEARR
jgi:SAM-dependent methyltransferase